MNKVAPSGVPQTPLGPGTSHSLRPHPSKTSPKCKIPWELSTMWRKKPRVLSCTVKVLWDQTIVCLSRILFPSVGYAPAAFAVPRLSTHCLQPSSPDWNACQSLIGPLKFSSKPSPRVLPSSQ